MTKTFLIMFLRKLQEIDAQIQIRVVTNRDDARQFLEGNYFFDLLSLDLTIPASSRSSDKKIEYGNEVLHFCNSVAPGLPILILTASSTDDLVFRFLGIFRINRYLGGGSKKINSRSRLKKKTG